MVHFRGSYAGYSSSSSYLLSGQTNVNSTFCVSTVTLSVSRGVHRKTRRTLCGTGKEWSGGGSEGSGDGPGGVGSGRLRSGLIPTQIQWSRVNKRTNKK